MAMIRKIVLALFEMIRPSIQRNTVLFAILGAAIVFSTIVIKDNISEDIRSHLESVEVAKQFYSVHSEDIELGSRLDNIDEKIQELKQVLENKEVSNSLQEIANSATKGNNEAAKDANLIRSSNTDTQDLLDHIDDSELEFMWDEGEERIIKYDVNLSNNWLAVLSKDIEDSRTELNEAYKMVSIPNHKFTPEELVDIRHAFATAKHSSDAAAIQGMHLTMGAAEDRIRALKAADAYRRRLEMEDRACRWVIIVLIVIGSVIGLLSQVVGIEREKVKGA
jgi:hypothetical protein